MTLKEQAMEWLRYAKHDFDSAVHLTTLKALLVIKDREVPKIHDLQKLWSLIIPDFSSLAEYKLHHCCPVKI